MLPFPLLAAWLGPIDCSRFVAHGAIDADARPSFGHFASPAHVTRPHNPIPLRISQQRGGHNNCNWTTTINAIREIEPRSTSEADGRRFHFLGELPEPMNSITCPRPSPRTIQQSTLLDRDESKEPVPFAYNTPQQQGTIRSSPSCKSTFGPIAGFSQSKANS